MGDLPYLLTLPGYGFYWFKLSREVEAPAWHEERLPRDDLPMLVLMDGWNSFRPERVKSWRAGVATKLRTEAEHRVLPAIRGRPAVVRRERRRRFERVAFADGGEWNTAHGTWLLRPLRRGDGATRRTERRRHFRRLANVSSCRSPSSTKTATKARMQKLQPGVIARVRRQAAVGVVADSASDENFVQALVEAIGTGE